jgi:hypothetical protein
LNKKLHILFFSLLALALLPLLSSFQKEKNEWIFIRAFKSSPIKSVSIDTYFNFYIGDDKGNVFKYDSLGNQMLRYSPSRKATISLLESWRTVNIFLFYRDIQEYAILDRFLTTSTPNSTFRQNEEDDETGIGFARLAALASDNNLWIFDDEDFSLKKYNTRINKVMLHTSLDLILDPSYYDLSFMREYQNLLFINDKNSGILVFDNLGNYKTKLPFKGLSYFSFLGNSIYFISEGSLIIYDIYTSEQHFFPLPEEKKYTYVLLSESKGYLFTSDSVEIYELNNEKK